MKHAAFAFCLVYGLSAPLLAQTTSPSPASVLAQAQAQAQAPAAAAVAAPALKPASCQAKSAAQPPALVELYTSEGCSSCPPADRWASKLKGRSDVLVLAFHVNYWDKLGWVDRFATPATTQRQHAVRQALNEAYVYTPQVVHNGRDLRAWPGAALPRMAPSAVQIQLQREGQTVRAQVSAPTEQSVAGFWAVLEDEHQSKVRAGENAGELLAHDHVVVQYEALKPWRASAAEQVFSLTLNAPSNKARRVAFVLTDASGVRPVQAVVLGC